MKAQQPRKTVFLLLIWLLSIIGCQEEMYEAEEKQDNFCSYQVGWTHSLTGGKGGEIIPVRTLDSEGSGSLREAINQSGPRIIVFEVGGVIDLNTHHLNIVEPFVSIVGQTAPSPGITIIRGSLVISTHDVLIQHITVRPGEAGQSDNWEPDGISLNAAYHVAVDHCSITWAIDENLTASGPRFEGETLQEWRENTSHDVTFSYNLIAEALSHSTHSKGEHSKGTLVHDNVTNILLYKNLYSSNLDRNPLFKCGAQGVIANNFIFNPANYAISYALVPGEWDPHPYQTGLMTIVGNVFYYGEDTSYKAPFVYAFGPLELHLFDNITQSFSDYEVPAISGLLINVKETTSPPIWPDSFSPTPSGEILEIIKNYVGSRPWDRTTIDQRIIEQTFNGTSRQIDNEAEVGGYPLATPSVYQPFNPDEWGACFAPLQD